jgi:hypothetical protein
MTRHDTPVHVRACICQLDMGNRVYADPDLAASVCFGGSGRETLQRTLADVWDWLPIEHHGFIICPSFINAREVWRGSIFRWYIKSPWLFACRRRTPTLAECVLRAVHCSSTRPRPPGLPKYQSPATQLSTATPKLRAEHHASRKVQRELYIVNRAIVRSCVWLLAAGDADSQRRGIPRRATCDGASS